MRTIYDKSVNLISKIEQLAVCLDAHKSDVSSDSLAKPSRSRSVSARRREVRRCISNRVKAFADWHNWAIDRDVVDWL